MAGSPIPQCRSWLASGMLSGLFLLGSGLASGAECVDTSPADAQQAIEDARRAVLTLEYDATLAKLEQVRKSLPCLTGTLPQDSLALLYFFEGVLKYQKGLKDEAMQPLKDAASVQPLLQEDREYESELRELWASSRDLITRTTGVLMVPNLPKNAVAYVDGRPLQSGSSQANVYPGVHLLQVTGDDGKLHGTLMRVNAGESTLVPAEFLASLTPRGELVLDVKPRWAKIVVRDGEEMVHTQRFSPRRLIVPEVKEGAYIVEVTRPGYYPFSQGKVAVEGRDQTLLKVELERRPSVGLNIRYGIFAISGEHEQLNPVLSFDLVGRNGSGLGLHLEYLHHVTDGIDVPLFTPNPDAAAAGEEETAINFPPEFPNVTTKDLPLMAKTYLGLSKVWRIEGVDVGAGAKAALTFRHFSVQGEVMVSYEPVPWVALTAKASIGPMIHASEYLWDMFKDDELSDYISMAAASSLMGGIKVGF